MAREVYLREITKTTKVHNFAFSKNTLSSIKGTYEASGWKSFYIRRNGKRYLVVEKNGDIKIFSYESNIG